jgi:hypothetical protein
MPFKDLEQTHNLVNRVILACGKHPVDADINPLLEDRLERFYEDAVVEGMAKQMHSSVDRAVNAMAKPWVGLTQEELDEIQYSTDTQVEYITYDEGDYGMEIEIHPENFARAIEAKLKEKNT